MKINKGGVVSAANIADLDLSTNKTINNNAREISSKGGKKPSKNVEDGFLVFRQLIVLDNVNDELMMIMIKSKVTLFF